MTDVVLFAGPVMVKSAFKSIDWQGRDVRIIPIVGSGSSYFATLAEQYRDSSGRILPNLLRKFAPGITPDKIALAAYSAGHGLLNKICDVDADRADVDAMILSDATFSGFQDQPKRGYVKFGLDAVRGGKLLVSTTADTTDGTHLSGRASFDMVWKEVARLTGARQREVTPPAGVPPASGGWWQMGSEMHWGVYSHGAANDLSHGDHHDLGALVWQAYLSPWLVGRFPWAWVAAGAAACAAVGYALID